MKNRYAYINRRQEYLVMTVRPFHKHIQPRACQCIHCVPFHSLHKIDYQYIDVSNPLLDFLMLSNDELSIHNILHNNAKKMQHTS